MSKDIEDAARAHAEPYNDDQYFSFIAGAESRQAEIEALKDQLLEAQQTIWEVVNDDNHLKARIEGARMGFIRGQESVMMEDNWGCVGFLDYDETVDEYIAILTKDKS